MSGNKLPINFTELTIGENNCNIRLTVRVKPRSAKNRIGGIINGVLIIAVTAPPVDGEANAAIIKYLAEITGIAKQRIKIASGQTGRNKIIEISGITTDEFIETLAETIS